MYPYLRNVGRRACATAACLALGCTPAALPSPRAGSPPSEASSVQTLGQGASAQRVRVVTVAEGLEHPWGMVWLPDGDLLVSERPGRIRRLRPGQKTGEAIAGVPAVFAEGQGGLLDLALHPRFAENRWLYFTYAHGTASANHTRVGRARWDGQGLRDPEVIYQARPDKSGSQHFGSRLAWLPDGTLLVAIGDGGNPPLELAGRLIREQAQNRQASLGKVLRLRDDGSPAPDNPLAGESPAAAALWSYGHRNIQGLSVDAATGQVWAHEHGARGGDEVNRLARGGNYGWPLVSHSQEYFGGPVAAERSRPGLVDPLWLWTPSIAPSGLLVYRGGGGSLAEQNRFAAWRGDLLAGGLVSRSLHHLDVDGAGKIRGETTLAIGQRVRDVRQGPDGLIYLLTDEAAGQLLRLEPVNSP